jgi:hypothetical protein
MDLLGLSDYFVISLDGIKVFPVSEVTQIVLGFTDFFKANGIRSDWLDKKELPRERTIGFRIYHKTLEEVLWLFPLEESYFAKESWKTLMVGNLDLSSFTRIYWHPRLGFWRGAAGAILSKR